MNFEKYAAHGNAFVNEVAHALEIGSDKDRAGRIVRSVLHALRARLTVAESFHLLAQLPMALKAVYVDGWTPSPQPDKHIKTSDDLVEQVLILDGATAVRDLPTLSFGRRAVDAVFHALKRHISAGEVRGVSRGLPRALQQMWDAA